MLNNLKMEQKNGSSSVNNQAQTIIINQGLDYVQAKEIFNDLFDANFYKMQNIAKETVLERVGKFKDEFISLLEKEGVTNIDKFKDPEFQYTLFEAQKTCAKRDSSQYRELVSKALLFKIKNENNNLLDIVLSESISTIGKLLPVQLDILALCFIIGRTMNNNVNSYSMLKSYIDQCIIPFSHKLEFKDSSIRHLEYCKCGTSLVGDKIEVIFQRNYEDIFYMPLTEEEVVPYLNDDTLETLITEGLLIEDANIIRDDVKYLDNVYRVNINLRCEKLIKYEGLVTFYKGRKLNEEQIKSCLVSTNDKMQNVIDKWNNILKSFTLTSVGLIIGAIHYENVVKNRLDLSIWI